MPESVTSVFSEAENFENALREEGFVGLLVTGAGEFRVRLTRVALHSLRLSAAEERLSRTALVDVPAGMILVALARGTAFAPFWGGMRLGADEIVILRASQRLNMRSDGPCRWGSIWLPEAELVSYGSALTGAAFAVPFAARWRLRSAMIRHLRHLYSAGIDAIERRSTTFISNEAAHGLEQQLIEALVECVSNGSAVEAARSTIEHRDVALRFETLLQAQPDRTLRTAEICSALDVSARALRLACEEQLGMGPAAYARRRRICQVDRSLKRTLVKVL